MFYLSYLNKATKEWGITDTNDGVTDIVSGEELLKYLNSGIKIMGVCSSIILDEPFPIESLLLVKLDGDFHITDGFIVRSTDDDEIDDLSSSVTCPLGTLSHLSKFWDEPNLKLKDLLKILRQVNFYSTYSKSIESLDSVIHPSGNCLGKFVEYKDNKVYIESGKDLVYYFPNELLHILISNGNYVDGITYTLNTLTFPDNTSISLYDALLNNITYDSRTNIDSAKDYYDSVSLSSSGALLGFTKDSIPMYDLKAFGEYKDSTDSDDYIPCWVKYKSVDLIEKNSTVITFDNGVGSMELDDFIFYARMFLDYESIISNLEPTIKFISARLKLVGGSSSLVDNFKTLYTHTDFFLNISNLVNDFYFDNINKLPYRCKYSNTKLEVVSKISKPFQSLYTLYLGRLSSMGHIYCINGWYSRQNPSTINDLSSHGGRYVNDRPGKFMHTMEINNLVLSNAELGYASTFESNNIFPLYPCSIDKSYTVDKNGNNSYNFYIKVLCIIYPRGKGKDKVCLTCGIDLMHTAIKHYIYDDYVVFKMIACDLYMDRDTYDNRLICGKNSSFGTSELLTYNVKKKECKYIHNTINKQLESYFYDLSNELSD